MIAFHKGEIPFTLLLVPFVSGLCVDMVYPCTPYVGLLWVCLTVLLSAFFALSFTYQRLQLYKVKWLGGLIVWCMLFLCGIISFNGNRQINLQNHFSKLKSKYLVGIVSAEPKLNAGILRFNVKVTQSGDTGSLKPVTGAIILSVKTDTAKKLNLTYGNEILFPARFNPVEPPMNPAEFNYKAYLAHQNIYHQAFLIQHQLTVLKHNQGNPLVTNALKLRVYLVNKLRANMRDTDAIAVASTIILGYRADLRKDVQEAYSKTGTMHLLSVAGMHVGLVYFMVVFFLNFLPHYRYTKLIKAVISIILIWCYALITGFSPAVSRAVLMLTMVIIGLTYNRHINKLNVLAVSAFILLLYNPFYITDAGFQLSYLAVFGIIIIQPYIYKWFDPKNKLLREVWLVCSVSISAQVILLPIGAWYFHDFPVYFLVSNIFIIIPSAIVMYAGIIYLALPSIPVLSRSLGWLLEKTVMTMTETLARIEHAPMGSVNKIWLNTFEFLLGYALIISVFCFLTLRNKQWLKGSLLIGLLLAISMSLKTYRSTKTSTISFLSVRKNTAVLFQSGHSAVLLTNLEADDKTWQYSVQPYMDSCKINKLVCIPSGKETATGYFVSKNNFIVFGDQKILMIDKKTSGKKFRDKITADYILITGSPRIDLNYLKQNYNFKLLVADGTNSAQLTKQLEKETTVSGINFLNLKRNKAMILSSN